MNLAGSLDSSNDYSDGEEDDDGSSLDAASLDARGPAVSSDAQIVALAKVSPPTPFLYPPTFPISNPPPPSKAMYSFKGTKQDDLTFEVGDMFAVIDRHVAPDWWLVEEQRSDGSAGKRGYAPEAYLQIVADSQQALALPGGAAGAGGMGSQPDLLHPDAPMEVPGTPAAAVRLASMSASKDHPLQRRRSSPKQHWLKVGGGGESRATKGNNLTIRPSPPLHFSLSSMCRCRRQWTVCGRQGPFRRGSAPQPSPPSPATPTIFSPAGCGPRWVREFGVACAMFEKSLPPPPAVQSELPGV